MKTKSFKLEKKDWTIIYNYLNLGHSDYLASRFLLLNRFLPQGCALATTAVEKYLKAILVLHKEEIPKSSHLNGNLLNKIKVIDSVVYNILKRDDFVGFLSKTYDVLRYASVKNGGFGIVINQYRTLVHLDFVVLELNKRFTFSIDGEIQKTPLDKDIEVNNQMLLGNNILLNEASKIKLSSPSIINFVQELKVYKDFDTLTVDYTTKGISNSGSFLKKSDISKDRNFKLTKG